MKPSTRLDSAVFQLTPTRTRCDLLILANGKTEKIASGLLSPFLSHLKAARDQMAKGGYSIILEPEAGCKATWFTKATIERFVRFVSTPEVLERVHTLESEIMQIEEAIAIQSNNEMGLQTMEGHRAKSAETTEAVKPVLDDNADKAIVLYKPDSHVTEENGSAGQGGDSKVQLLKVLETRRTVLQKEQGMAFARAVAAGFDIDLLTPLISFAESFGASRLMDACSKFIDLWKRKHETGQWVEIEEAEAISGQSDYASMSASGIIISDMVNKEKGTLCESSNNMASVENGKASAAVASDDQPRMNTYVPPGYPEYFPGQFLQMYPPWPIQSPPGAPPGFQAYPMPYFQNYPGSNPYFQQSSPPVEDPRLYSAQRVHQKRHPNDRRSSDTGIISSDELEQDDDLSPSESRKKGSSSRKKQGMVVIRNINYITKKQQESSDSESHSESGVKSNGEYEPLDEAASPERMHKASRRSQEKRLSGKNSTKKLTLSGKEETSFGNEADGGHWQAFQDYLLKERDEDKQESEQDILSMEKEVWLKRRQNMLDGDPLATNGQSVDEIPEGLLTDMVRLSERGVFKRGASKDGLLVSHRKGDGSSSDGHPDVHSTEISGRGGYRRTEADDFIIHRQENSFNGPASGGLALNRYEGAQSSQDIEDDSYIVSHRSASADVGDGSRKGIDIDSEFPSAEVSNNCSSKKVLVSYEPDDLSMMPERGLERCSSGYDPTLDYEIQVRSSLGKSGKMAEASKQRPKDPKGSQTPDTLGKKKNVGPIRKGKPSKLSPLDEARARADKLRSYKADLQKLKKEKEEEQIKRIEALKLERQKRIAARSGSIPAQSTQISQQGRKSLPAKLSPSSHKGSKFSDVEPGSSSPLQRTVRTTNKPNRSTAGSSSVENRLTRSTPSLPEPKKENNLVAEKKASLARMRRLSEPKMANNNLTSSVKPRTELAKAKVSDDSDKKKISAIINLDQSKAATLPELKIRTAKGPDSAKSTTAKETTLKAHGTAGKQGASSLGTGPKGNVHNNSQHIDDDDNLIVEKAVVVLENEKPAVPVPLAKDGKVQTSFGNCVDQINGEVINAFPKQSSPSTTSSPVIFSGSGTASKPMEHQVKKPINTCKLPTHKEVSPKVSNVSHDEKPYQAPYARVSSLEDPCTIESDYGKALPPAYLDLGATRVQSMKAQVPGTSNTETENINDSADKPSKESAKGFKRLLKFGRKNIASSEKDSDAASVGGSDVDDHDAKPASSAEVHTLKNLISQDETPTAVTTPKKSSRGFSLLSPFRSKNSEKKHAT